MEPGGQLLALARNKGVVLNNKKEERKLPSVSTFLARYDVVKDSRNLFSCNISPILRQQVDEIDNVVVSLPIPNHRRDPSKMHIFPSQSAGAVQDLIQPFDDVGPERNPGELDAVTCHSNVHQQSCSSMNSDSDSLVEDPFQPFNSDNVPPKRQREDKPDSIACNDQGDLHSLLNNVNNILDNFEHVSSPTSNVTSVDIDFQKVPVEPIIQHPTTETEIVWNENEENIKNKKRKPKMTTEEKARPVLESCGVKCRRKCTEKIN